MTRMSFVCVLAVLTACPMGPGGEGDSNTPPTGTTPDPANIVEDTVCPKGPDDGFSLCHMQNPESPNYLATGASAAFNGVVVTSPSFRIGNSESTRMGVFLSDANPAVWGAFSTTMHLRPKSALGNGGC